MLLLFVVWSLLLFVLLLFGCYRCVVLFGCLVGVVGCVIVVWLFVLLLFDCLVVVCCLVDFEW